MVEHVPASLDTERSDETTTCPDGGYGWVCVAACFTINTFTWGLTASYGVYLSYYLNHGSFPGAQPLDFAFIGGSNFAAAMLSAPLVTVLSRKYGTRPTMFVGVCSLSAGFVTASFATETWQLYISQGVMVGIGVGFLYIPSIAILSQWFQKRRSLANGITGAGSGIGGILFSLSAAAMIERISLPWALRITGIIVFVMNALATALIKDRNRTIQPQQHPFDTMLLRRCDVWLVLCWVFISMLGYITLLYSLPDFALSIGLSDAQATDVVTLMNVGMAVGRPFIGSLSDRFGRILVPAILTFVCGLASFAIWLPASSFGVTVLFALISDDRTAVRRDWWFTATAVVAFSLVACHCITYIFTLKSILDCQPTMESKIFPWHEPSRYENPREINVDLHLRVYKHQMVLIHGQKASKQK
ncbi:MAG: hypothetical protein Q9220_006900 [cf. Caloplaca sp. 1 TL-2023]